MNVITNDLKNKIFSSIQEILNNVFLRGGKTQIRDMRGRLTFACPYCGDSTIDENKKRGNLFFDTLRYKCFNDGCKKHTTYNKLIKDFKTSNNLTVSERLHILDYIKSNVVKYNNTKNELRYHLFDKLYEYGVNIEDFYKYTNSSNIIKNSYGYNILKERLLTNKKEYFAIGYKKLYILNLTHDKKKVIGYQIRFLDKNTKNKYKTYNLEKLRTICKLNNNEILEGSADIEQLNKLSTLFNIMNINFSEVVTIFEGPIDSMFMYNSLGLASVNKDIEMFNDLPDIRFFFDNDKAGKSEMINLLKKDKSVFMWHKFINDFNLNIYLNDKINCIKDLNDLIKICYYNKLDAYKSINKYFSSSSFDLINI